MVPRSTQQLRKAAMPDKQQRLSLKGVRVVPPMNKDVVIIQPPQQALGSPVTRRVSKALFFFNKVG